jgi:hypothetical protein
MQIMLAKMKVDRGIRNSTAYDERFTQLLTAAQKAIIKEGASTLDASDPGDQELIVEYAEWLWNKRTEMTGMPRMLRWALNNRIFAEKAGGANG